MDKRLATLIAEYQGAVRRAVELLAESRIPIPSSNLAWTMTDIPQLGTLAGGIKYFKHGFGCAVELPDHEVDFDFGERGEIDGLDEWFVTRFADGRLDIYGFNTDAEIRECFDSSVRAGELGRSGDLLYFRGRRDGA